MNQQRLGYCVLLLIVIFVLNKSKENATESLYHANNNERYDNTTHFATSPRNKSAQTLRDVFRENSNKNNVWKERRSTSTGRKELDEEEDDIAYCEKRLYVINPPRNESVQTRGDEHRRAIDEEDDFVQSTVPNNGEGQVYAKETSIAFFAIPRRYKDGIYFIILPRNITKNNNNNYIRFCCPLGHRFSPKQKKCLVDPEFVFPVLNNKYVFNKPVNIRVFSPLPSCENGYSLYVIDPIRYPDSEYYFYDDELVIFPHIKLADMLRKYCLAIVNKKKVFDLIQCTKIMHTPATAVATIVSSIFLLITFVMYSVLREFRKMHLLRAYIASLFVSTAMYAVYLQVPVDTMNYFFCSLLFFIFLFAMYSTFLWLNVTCFDIWRTTRKFSRLHEKVATPDRTSRRFMIYSLYAWGVSFVLTSLTIIMNIVPKTSIPNWLIIPCICKETIEYPPSFWFGTRKARNIYFYLPIGITSICNICLFVWIALEILCDKKRMNRPMRDSENRRHDDCNKKRLWMCLKLFILMVINWIPITLAVEVGRWIVDIESAYLWHVANLITSLKGIIIFILFVCKKKVISLLMQRFGWSDESSLCHFRMRRTGHHEEVALADYRDQHNEIRESTENTGN